MSSPINTITVKTTNVYDLNHKLLTTNTTKYRTVYALVDIVTEQVLATNEDGEYLLRLRGQPYYSTSYFTKTKIAWYGDIDAPPTPKPQGI